MSRPQSRAPPPLPSLVTPSASPQPHSAFYRPDSLPPLKRQRLSTPSRASSSSSLQDATFDVEKERGDSVQRLLGTWSQLEERWTRRIDEDDVIDLRTLDVIENRGVLESMSKPREFGISKDSDATRDRASVDDEDDEDSDDDLDAITGFDMNDRPIEDAYSDDNISTTDEDDGSPLQDPLPKPIGHYGRLDINNPKDADDLRAFLEAERLRKALQGDDDRDEIDFEGDSTIVYDDGPPHVEPEEVLQLSEHDDKDNSSEDELAAPEEKLSFFPRKKVIRNVEPIRAVPKPSFKVPKLPDVSSKPSPSKNQQLQTPPRSSSIQSTDFSSLPSPLPSPISPRSRRPSKPAPLQEKIHRSHTSVTDLDKVSRINLSQVHSVDKKRKGTPRTAAQVTKPLTEPSPRPSPSKKSRMHPEVVIVRPKSKERVPVISKPLIKEKSLPSKKLEKTPKPQMEESSSDDESVRELPSSPLKGKSRARSSHVVSDSEDDEPLRKPPPRAPRPAVAVPTRKRKRSSDAPRRASSQAVQVDSPDEEMHPPPARNLPRTPKRPKSRIPTSEDEESPPHAGPSKYNPHSHLRDTVSPEPYNKVKRRSKSRMQSADSDDERYRHAGSSHQRSRSYFDPLPPSSDPDYHNPYPPPYPPPDAIPYAEQALWEAMHHLSSYFLKGRTTHGPPPPPNHLTPSRHQHPSSVYNTPTHPHSYPYAYDPNFSRGTLPPSSPEVESSPMRGRDEIPHRASSIVERSRSRGRRVSFKFEAQEEEEDESFQGKGKGRAIAKPTRKDDVGTPPPQKREKSRTRQHMVGRSVQDDTDSSSSESEPDNRPQRRGRSQSRAQTPGPSMNKGYDERTKRRAYTPSEAKGKKGR
ncbi:hypothetical protein CPB85DRAFT_1433414 [Mucidula mucida]|nr:hypothetical protein CPB85DRAFT_1433414 [Mucidula mucida]